MLVCRYACMIVCFSGVWAQWVSGCDMCGAVTSVDSAGIDGKLHAHVVFGSSCNESGRACMSGT
jgi:hypothetical protein